MPEEIHEALTPVDSSLVTMARAVREAMRGASTALLGADQALAQSVLIRDTEIDVLYRVVEDRVYDLAGRHPAPDAFRAIMTALRMAADLKRMGVLAAHVARAVLRRHPGPAVVPELADLFRAMSRVADDLAEKLVRTLVDRDRVLAGELDAADDAMDDLHRRLYRVVISSDWPLGAEAAIDAALLGRYYERYADHAVNIGHHVQYLTTWNPTYTR
jgi:phosphate transport system protein